MNDNPVKTPLVDLLRSVKVDSWAEITEPSGWKYSANYIGRITHEAADLIEAQQKEIIELKQYVLDLDREAQTGEFQNAKVQG